MFCPWRYKFQALRYYLVMVLKVECRQAVDSSSKIELLRIVCHSQRIDIKKEGITVDGFLGSILFRRKFLFTAVF